MKSIKTYCLVSVFICCTSVLLSQELKRSHWKLHYKEGTNYLKNDSISKALAPLERAFMIAEKYFRNKEKYGKSLIAYYEVNLKLKSVQTIDSLNLTDAIFSFSESLNLSDRVTFSKKIEHLANMALRYNYVSKAILLNNDRVFTLKKAGDTLSVDYALVLNGLGKSYLASLKNYENAKNNLEKALSIIKNKTSDELSENDVLTDLVNVYLRLNQRIEADQSAEKILSNISNTKGKEHADYTNKLNKLGEIYLSNGLLEKAAFFETEAIRIYEEKGDFESMEYLLANYMLGRIEKENNNYEESIKAYEKVQNVFIEKGFDNLDNYAIVLGNIGLCYDRLGDYQKAIHYCDLALSVKGISNYTKSTRLMDMGYFYENIGRFDKAHETYELALESMELSHGKEHQEFAKLLNNIGKLYFEEGKYEEAKTYFLQALQAVEVKEGEKWHEFYSYMLNDYAKTLFQLGDVKNAEALMKKNIAYFKNNNLPDDEDYYNRNHDLAKLYNLTQQYSKAKPLIDNAADNIKLILGSDHEDYGRFLKTRSETYFGLNENDNAVAILKESNNVFLNQVDKIFRFSSEIEKKAFLKMISKHFDDMQSIAFTKDIQIGDLKELNLNNQLLLKGLLLNNTKGLLRDLKQLNDNSINHKLQEYKSLKKLLAKVLTEPISKRTLNVDSLKQIINSSETSLVRLHSKNFNQSQSFLRNWKDIQNYLEPNEIAVEFAHFNIVENGSLSENIQYLAYVFNNSNMEPKVIPLFKENELKNVLNVMDIDRIYTSDETYSLIWEPLESIVSNSETIYFSSTGILNQIALAALTKDNVPIIEKYNLIQLSSTYNLIDLRDNIAVNSSLLIGGVNYDFKQNEIETEVEPSFGDTTDDFSFSQVRGTKTRGESWTYLEGTVSEINSINKILSEFNVSASLLTNNEATEESFKRLDGSSPSLIHIATHGYFFENSSFQSRNQSKLSMEDQYRLAQDPLLRSGLILANANYAWKYTRKPLNIIEDGILTALEISNLDLSATNLVVMSACETGLGDIEGSEGVYGLQRAFKMAGVNKIIMSLWEVPDFETSEFMESFYHNWLNRQSINLAFIQTQRQMVKKYRNQPSKWAAFVLFE
ncbi:CHAT domain-containing protein [Winogradskyella aquimaris]|uniref:CHAT domain-containing tetratricopeptide repeat protein n=1 Tax=Winogradskyella aquimaris TaxID=864074 RepID=A0ABU5ETX0_9FLAO|nr:CHAT domain-containing tetratricopeptide repeat protein [Winogradskyella aquimaris]MDY2588346.1 CHAT domain-containing tetratricopeptide repeat protein [Winogradskyella aquimaris]